ncbi:hypothetical protein IV203_010230 [Nitzschia inconspicua]|uniref:Uncharacterized protein n=1 Tax=Nitzschia inconspicua TaxID=303405 RepID=A0A9K3KVQ3_9STRA|nr:hypothetical protein IV203_010230 [Nitzschia inconspicua]
MDGETFMISPDAVVVLGFRSVLSMVGLTTAFVGYWMMERQWDNHGAAVLRRRVAENNAGSDKDENADTIGIDAPKDENSSNYVAIPDPPSQVAKGGNTENSASTSFAAAEMMLCGQVFHESGCRDLVRVGTFDSQDPKYHPSRAGNAEDAEGNLSATAAQYYNAEPTSEFQAHLESAFPLPKVLLAGTSIWSISVFFDPNFGGFRLYINAWNVMMFLLAACVGPILAFPIREATLKRDLDRKKKATWVLALDFVLITCFSIGDWMVQNKKIWYIPLFGVLFILVSHYMFQRNRRMGLSWDQEGKAKSSSQIYVQNLATPLLILGIVLFWIGTNAVLMADLYQTYLPIWTTVSRSWCVVLAVMLLIVPAHMALDFAFDQGSQPVVVLEQVKFYTLDGKAFTSLLAEVRWVPETFVATILETPIWLALGWTFMALNCFLPFGVTGLTVQQFCCMGICIAMAPVYGMFVLPALWTGNLGSFTKWSYFYYGLMVAWATSIGIGGGIALLLSVAGILFVLVGHRWDLYERKRGMPWLATNMGDLSNEVTLKTVPQVYGIGQPLGIFGWVLLCLAMSIPM